MEQCRACYPRRRCFPTILYLCVSSLDLFSSIGVVLLKIGQLYSVARYRFPDKPAIYSLKGEPHEFVPIFFSFLGYVAIEYCHRVFNDEPKITFPSTFAHISALTCPALLGVVPNTPHFGSCSRSVCRHSALKIHIKEDRNFFHSLPQSSSLFSP